MSSSPSIAIIILHWKSIPALIDCLTSLDAVSCANCTVTIINNGPNDLSGIGTVATRPIETIRTTANLGFSRGNNVGIKEALRRRADYVLLLNDDTLVSPDFLPLLVESAERDPAVAMAGPVIYYADAPRQVWFAGARFTRHAELLFASRAGTGDNAAPESSDYITGCALLARSSSIETIGLLDERFFLYWEDVDWGLRARKAGYTNLVIPSARIWHKVSLSTGGMESPLRAYHKTRSHLLMAKLHAPATIGRLHRKFLRDMAWLVLKSSDEHRMKKAFAYGAAIRDYHLGRTGRGPNSLWRSP